MGVGHRDGITTFVIGITAMAFDMGQGHIRKTRCIQRLPEIAVEHSATRGGAPTLALPAIDPTGEAIDQILAVGTDGQAFGTRQLLQALERFIGNEEVAQQTLEKIDERRRQALAALAARAHGRCCCGMEMHLRGR